MKQLERGDLFRRMSDNNMILRVQLEITRACNLSCSHCNVKYDGAPQSPIMTAPEINQLLSDLVEAGVIHINLTGGEPFIRPDAAKIIQSIFDKNFFLSIQTNATLLDDRHFNLLAENKKRIKQISISLYGVTPETHALITGDASSFTKTKSAILRLKSLDLPVVALSVVSKQNAHEFDALELFCRDNDIPFQYTTLILPRGNGDTTHTGLRLDCSQLCSLPKPWDRFREHSWQPDTFTPDSPLSNWCSMASTTCYIDASGDVRPCSIVPMSAGNVRNEKFIDIWRSSQLMRDIRSRKLRDFECSACESFADCHPCPGLSFAETGSLTASPREMCRIISVFSKQEAPAL